jgi:branched-chain amino acid transport system permease protein
MSAEVQPIVRRRLNLARWVQPAMGVAMLAFMAWRLWLVLVVQHAYGPDVWVRFAISGVILGSVYAVIALGYTLVYGILFMINFAHGDVMMVGAFAGFFTLTALNATGYANRSAASSIVSIAAAFLVGILTGMAVAITLERIAYRPLRMAPRLVPLISAIGASLFLENAAQLMFGAARQSYPNPSLLERNTGWTLLVGGEKVLITYSGALTLILSFVLMIGLYFLVMKTKMGRSMRAVAEDKNTAALMGINVDRVIANTFATSGVLAGAAGVMWGLHMGIIYPFVGFVPGLKAFTAAVMGGIGSVPGAMLGGLSLGVLESMGPAVLGIDYQLKDVVAFAILVLVLVFRPTGLLGEVLAQKKA